MSDKVAGFVLAGGRSRRLGRDKALLDYAGATLVEAVAHQVQQAAGSVALLGDLARYGHLGLPVVPDLIPACGPMSGLHAALHHASAEWILIVACDLPNVNAAVLHRLVEAARSASPGVVCVAAQGVPMAPRAIQVHERPTSGADLRSAAGLWPAFSLGRSFNRAGGLEPLCAVYHRNTRPEVELALREGRLRMRDLVARLGAARVEVDPRVVLNVNTEEDWRLHLAEKEQLH